MGMRLRPIACRVLLVALACLALASPAAAQRRVLYLDYVHPNAHNHLSRVNARAAMTAIAQASGGLFTMDLRTDPTGLDAAALAPYDALVFFTCGDLPADHPLRPALLAFVAGGKGFVGFHSATDSFYSWPEYGDLIGGRFVNHGSDNRPGTIRVEDPNHVAMQGFTNPFSFTEEFYLFRGPSTTSIDRFTRRDLHVLMNLDPATPTPARPTPQPEFPQLDGTDLPLAWTRQHGAGRVFYSALGHRPETWDNAQFRDTRARRRSAGPWATVTSTGSTMAGSGPGGCATTTPPAPTAPTAIPTATAGPTRRSRPPARIRAASRSASSPRARPATSSRHASACSTRARRSRRASSSAISSTTAPSTTDR